MFTAGKPIYVLNRIALCIHASQSSACGYYPSGGLSLVPLIVLLVVFFGRDRVAWPARMIRQFLRRSASTIAIFIKTSSVGRTQSIGIALQCSVGQMMRSGPFPRVPPITWISCPVMILLQTRQ
ncbi:MAG: DUF3309 family protein [Verrucomicrobia bacterium]|nr:MAG: DUF3309 family protein [Verrucomicrobiota bacterium]